MATGLPAFTADTGWQFSPEAELTERPQAIVHSFAAEVILRVAAQARRDRIEASAPKIALLRDALLGADDGAASDFMRDARLSGMPADTLYHGLLAGAVQQVGDVWARDSIAMPEMLRASHRVWRIMNDLREVFVRLSDRKPGQHAVFAPCPGEGHLFGLTLAADDLRRRGWTIDVVQNDSADDLVQEIEGHAPITVALGATSIEMILPLTRLVVALRAHIPGVWVMIGGPIISQESRLLSLTGADALANSADEAEQLMLAHMDALIQRRANRI
ncbi:B12-binding domain-containing protein [Pseudorhodobacter sp. MZDSW-24AT]|uniref:cobalamin B12-binding domain-containing protein n=1 Tax=Pseudorhodobacter sp. MZDSW-24AT TaxID=2052957 RepID=UPI000C1E28BE|nr:cobalamin-dependent protein [Pseudorhodobacter sp. MZDSW-24AT]PJF08324.1 hypothetical protein CUR21_15255 [Pseudorhodobacter sp. MZDSW-24AT]